MRALGIIALLIGIAGFALTLSVDTSVPVTGEYGKRVHNVGLISEKQNLLLTFAVIVVVGTIFVGIGRRVRHSSSAGSASGPQEDKAFEEKWLILTKYDESTQHALKRLNAYGAPAVEALKKAFFAIGDPSKLPKVADQIAREIEEGRQTALANEVQHVRQMATHQQLDMLTEAIAYNNIPRVRALISEGIDVNAPDEHGVTPIQWARKCGRKEIIELLNKARARG